MQYFDTSFEDLTQQTFVLMKTLFVFVFKRRLQDVLMKTNPSKHLLVFKTSWRRLQDMSRRRLQHVFSLTILRLPRRFEDVLKTSWRSLAKTSWRRFQDLSQDFLKTSWRRLEDISWRCLQDVSEANKFLLVISVSNLINYIWEN